MQQQNTQTLSVTGISAPVTLIRSSRKTLSAEIRADGSVIVRAPNRMPLAHIMRFLQEKAANIEKYVQLKQQVDEKRSRLTPFSEAEIAEMSEAAKRIIPPRVQHYAALLGVSFGRITIRRQRGRWGSCSANGNLSFNCLLAAMPEDVRDSVIAHELCHRLHPDHSPAFYADLYRIFPDYEQCRAWLKQNGGDLLYRLHTEA